MFKTLSGLNGWQRLWFVFAVISFIAVTTIVVVAQKPTSAVEDVDILSQLNADEITKVNIPQLGKVSFPNTMSKEDIEQLISKYYNTSRDTIPQLAASLIHERNENQAARAKVENAGIRDANLRLIGLGYLAWLLFIVTVYLLGYSVGWIYRGFKRT